MILQAALITGAIILFAYIAWVTWSLRDLFTRTDHPETRLRRLLDEHDAHEKRRRYPRHPDPTTDRRIR